MFAGIGGFRAGLTRAGGFQCVGHCEIDKYADASYRAIHDIGKEELYYPDATQIDPDTLPEFDLICGGFPCQAFSNAGKRRGFEDARGTLFFEIARLAEARRPPYLLLENVPGLLSHDQGRTFTTILSALDDLGYHVEWMVLNSKDFGVPQSRKRVFIICYLDPRCAGKILPVPETSGQALIQILDGPQGSRVYDAEGLACTQTAGAGGMGGKTGLYFVDLCKGHPTITPEARCLTAKQDGSLTNFKGQSSGVLCFVGFNRKEGILGQRDTALALNASDYRGLNRNQAQNAVVVSDHEDTAGILCIKEATKKGYKEACPGDTVNLGYAGSNTRRGRVGHDIAHTLETSCAQGIVERGGRIRRLMPRECLRLQGFTDDQIDKLLAITSDAQAYKQAGNSVTVNVIEAIGRNLRAVHEELREADQ